MARRKSGKSRGNKTYVDSNGDIWDSQFEWYVYHGLRGQGHTVRRCDERDAISYNTHVQQGRCLECGYDRVVQERIYTPDLFVSEVQSSSDTDDNEGPSVYFLECKGYLRQQRRAQLGSLARQRPDISLRILFSEERKLTAKYTNVEYALKYYKWPAAAWNGGAYEWRYP